MLENKQGQRIPEVIFRTRDEHEWVDVSSTDIFNNKTVIVFSLPGAFTPTCSSSHVPRFNKLAPVFREYGVDEVICISVNDAFVMNEWKLDQCAENIRFLPDGNGEFTEKMGMLVDKNDLGFGKRSWRYSMLVKNGMIEKMFIEPDQDGDPYEVSDADTMLSYLAPECDKPSDVAVFSRKGCPYCAKAKALLRDANMQFEELLLNRDYTDQTLRAIGGTTFPQVYIDGQHIGGSDDLEAWLQKNKSHQAA